MDEEPAELKNPNGVLKIGVSAANYLSRSQPGLGGASMDLTLIFSQPGPSPSKALAINIKFLTTIIVMGLLI